MIRRALSFQRWRVAGARSRARSQPIRTQGARHASIALGLGVAFAVTPRAVDAGSIDLASVAVEERLGDRIPLDLRFRDDAGGDVTLGDFFAAGKPVVLVLAYFDCPMLCGLVLRGTAQALRELGWSPGDRYRVVTVSFDPKDGPTQARQKQASLLAALGQDGRPEAWPFLTGDAGTIARLAGALGFNAVRDPRTGQFAHPAVVFVLTPRGEISRYLYGIQFRSTDVKLALLEASEGRIGSTLEKVLLRCYAYDPATRRYGVYVAGVMRTGGVFLLAAVGGLVGVLWHRERRKRRS